MSYKVFARKWRPLNFAQLVGQEHVVRSLVNALEHDRLHHAYLFSGTRGVGKTTIARVLAKALNCADKVGAEPCGKCQTCLEIDQGYYPDLIEVDAASRTGVDDTRELLENVQYAPSRGKYKVYLIDEVHMFSKSSFNALLKTLEEPPEHVKFLLATTDPQKMPVTVLSRCLQFNLKRLLPEQIEGQFKLILESEGIDYQAEATVLLARAADGSMRDGLSLLDQAIVFGNGVLKEEDVINMLGSVAREPILDILTALASMDGKTVLDSVQELDQFAPDYAEVLQSLLTYLHKISVAQVVPDAETDSSIEQLVEKLSKEDVQLFYQIGLVGQKDLSLAPNPKVGFEMVLLRMVTFSPSQSGEVKAVPSSLEAQPQTQQVNQSATTSVTKAPRITIPEKKAPDNLSLVTEDKKKDKPAAEVDTKATKVSVPIKEELKSTVEVVWSELLPLLALDPMTMQLAKNSALVRIDENECELLLAKGHVSLNEKSEQRLEAALSDYFARKLKLVFRQDEEGVVTPNAIEDKKQLARQQKAEQEVRSNKTVNKIIEMFDAKIIEGSIKPIDK
ncbi:MAG: DNA polymerase III subunit gamma/tau [Cycloclasticus sp. symbiont of Poecilosclerida sp. M]|nr:MAG: DNA polymerase III subunit gamma/tau [Cycloclasticus sp. symbiont of Poecilosclerida sp. M]